MDNNDHGDIYKDYDNDNDNDNDDKMLILTRCEQGGEGGTSNCNFVCS